MSRARATVVLCLVVFAGLAALLASTLSEPEFDLVSGVEWSERVRAAANQPSVPVAVEQSVSPRITSGLILLAGGLIVSVTVFGLHARTPFNSVVLRPAAAKTSA